MEADIKIYDVVDSTNTTLEEMAKEGAPEGTCVVALAQRKGQGRSGRTFFSPGGGNLYMSFLLRPEADKAGMLTVTAAVCVVEAIKEIFGTDTGIKWVNDITCRGKKVCGIVAQAHNYGSDDMYVVIGIGINIYESDDVPHEIKDIYASLIGKRCDLGEKEQKEQALILARKILERFSYHHEKRNMAEVIDIYRQHCCVTGRTVEYVYGDRTFRAKVLGIDDTGGIILDEDGVATTYHDGEIRITPTY